MPQLDDRHGCTISTCSLDYATIKYIPTLFGNTFFLSFFSLFLLIQSYQAYRYRTWSYSIAMVLGLSLEIVGYVGRVQLHYDPFSGDYFLLYIICLTIGPAFFAATIYLTFSRVLVHFSPTHTLSRFSPRTIFLAFITSDITALVLQAVGGGLANEASDVSGRDKGTNVMVAGLAFQVVSLLAFIAVAVDFAFNVRKERRFVRELEKGSGTGSGSGDCSGSSSGEGFRSRTAYSFRVFLVGMSIATVLILTQSVYRVAELSRGFTSKLANTEVLFTVFGGIPIGLAVFFLTIEHPGVAFGGRWADAGWSFRRENMCCGTEVGINDSPPLVLKKEMKRNG